MRMMMSFLVVATIVGTTVSESKAQFFRDDFADGSATDGSPVKWVVPSWVPNGQFRVENEDLILTPSNTAPKLPGYNGERTEMDMFADGVSLQDVSLTTRVRGLSSGIADQPYYIGLSARDTITRDWITGSAVTAYIGSDGKIGVGYLYDNSISGGPTQVTPPLTSTGLNFVAEDVNLQFDLIGNRAQLTAWSDSQLKPTKPQVTTTLPNFLASSGTVVLWNFPTIGDWNKPTAFRYIEAAPVPEPNSSLISSGLLAGLSLTSLRRKRRHFVA